MIRGSCPVRCRHAALHPKIPIFGIARCPTGVLVLSRQLIARRSGRLNGCYRNVSNPGCGSFEHPDSSVLHDGFDPKTIVTLWADRSMWLFEMALGCSVSAKNQDYKAFSTENRRRALIGRWSDARYATGLSCIARSSNSP